MATHLSAAIDARLSRDNFNVVDKISDIVSNFAARGFSEPSGPMYHEIEELCVSRMEQTVEAAIAVYQEQLAQGSGGPDLKAELIGYLQSRLGSLSATALQSHNRPANPSSTARMESKVRMLLSRAERV